MKRRRNNHKKFTGTPLGKLVAGTQAIKLDGMLNLSAGSTGGTMHFCYTMHVIVNYN